MPNTNVNILNSEEYAEQFALTMEKDYGAFIWSRAVDVSEQASDAESFTQTVVGTYGKAKRAGRKDNTASVSGAYREKGEIPIWDWSNSILFTEKDQRLASRGDWDMINTKMAGLRTVYEQTNDDVVFLGEDEYKGLTNLTLKTAQIKQAANKIIATVSAEDIYSTVIDAVAQVFKNTSQSRSCNTILLPTDAMLVLTQKYYAAQPGVSLLEAIRRGIDALPQRSSTLPLEILGTAALDASDTGLFYDRSSDVLQYRVPQTLTVGAPKDVDGEGEYKVTGKWRSAPLAVLKPQAIFRLTNVTK